MARGRFWTDEEKSALRHNLEEFGVGDDLTTVNKFIRSLKGVNGWTRTMRAVYSRISNEPALKKLCSKEFIEMLYRRSGRAKMEANRRSKTIKRARRIPRGGSVKGDLIDRLKYVAQGVQVGVHTKASAFNLIADLLGIKK